MSVEKLFHLEKHTICFFSVTEKATGYQKGTPTRKHLPYVPLEEKAEATATVIKKDTAFFGKFPIKIRSSPMLSLICFWFQCSVQAVHTANQMNWDRADGNSMYTGNTTPRQKNSSCQYSKKGWILTMDALQLSDCVGSEDCTLIYHYITHK